MSTAFAITLLVCAGLLALAIVIAHSLVADEIRAWIPYLARRLTRSAARQLPANSGARLEADWLAELTAWEDRPLSALAKAVHIRWKARAIRESLGGVQVGGEALKRAFDLSLAIGLLVLLAPLLLVTAIAIKLDSPGPVLYRQPRAGRGEGSFGLLKFRSMYVETEAHEDELRMLRESRDDVTFRIYRDPRLTRVGAFIRRLSLDEVPQLLNVIKGDMSLVGPRPMHPREAEAVRDEEGSKEPAVRPGLTGPGQLHFFLRRPRTAKEVHELDEGYARSRSLLGDIKLMARTLWTVISAGIGRRDR